MGIITYDIHFLGGEFSSRDGPSQRNPVPPLSPSPVLVPSPAGPNEDSAMASPTVANVEDKQFFVGVDAWVTDQPYFHMFEFMVK